MSASLRHRPPIRYRNSPSNRTFATRYGSASFDRRSIANTNANGEHQSYHGPRCRTCQFALSRNDLQPANAMQYRISTLEHHMRRNECGQSSKANDSASLMDFHPVRCRRHKLRRAKTGRLAIAMQQIAVWLKKTWCVRACGALRGERHRPRYSPGCPDCQNPLPKVTIRKDLFYRRSSQTQRCFEEFPTASSKPHRCCSFCPLLYCLSAVRNTPRAARARENCAASGVITGPAPCRPSPMSCAVPRSHCLRVHIPRWLVTAAKSDRLIMDLGTAGMPCRPSNRAPAVHKGALFPLPKRFYKV
jgi:hypothetical protein